MNIQYRFLAPEDFLNLYETTLTAFADYAVPLKMRVDQFENHFAQNAIDINFCVGAFKTEKMVGYTLNGFGLWHGKKTAYDAGTGVLPEYRNKGIGRAIFDFLLPQLKEIGIEQMLLEVMSDNKNAIRLYRKLGFKVSRNLKYFEQTDLVKVHYQDKKIEVRQIEKIEWKNIKSFCDGYASWQFSDEAIDRKTAPTEFFGAFHGDKCIGYSIFFPTSGIIPQIAVDKNYRNKSVGLMLIAKMQINLRKNKKLRMSNIDDELESLIKFAEKMKFKPMLSQVEMILEL